MNALCAPSACEPIHAHATGSRGRGEVMLSSSTTKVDCSSGYDCRANQQAPEPESPSTCTTTSSSQPPVGWTVKTQAPRALDADACDSRRSGPAHRAPCVV